jgi:hypothetical protein
MSTPTRTAAIAAVMTVLAVGAPVAAASAQTTAVRPAIGYPWGPGGGNPWNHGGGGPWNHGGGGYPRYHGGGGGGGGGWNRWHPGGGRGY